MVFDNLNWQLEGFFCVNSGQYFSFSIFCLSKRTIVCCYTHLLSFKLYFSLQRIAEYAEYLSYNRVYENFTDNWTYNFYNADNITNDERDEAREAEMRNYILNVSIFS